MPRDSRDSSTSGAWSRSTLTDRGQEVVRMPCLGHARTGPAGEELVGASPGRISVAFHEGDAMTAAGQEQGGGEPA